MSRGSLLHERHTRCLRNRALRGFAAGLAWLLLTSCGEAQHLESATEAEMSKRVQPDRLAGGWYDADPLALRRELQGYLNAARVPALSRVIALIQPHAGYRFSGAVAAHGVRALEGTKVRRVVVIGPTHRVYLRNRLALPDATHFRTPLGEIPLDQEFMRKLKESRVFCVAPEAHALEHSVQIQLPLLQMGLDSFQLVPIVCGQLDEAAIREAADALSRCLDDQTLVVASTDFTHYGPNYGYVPFKEDIEENLRRLDMGAVERIQKRDWRGFIAYCEQTGATICGRDPVAVVLALLPEQAEAHLLRYDTSGRMVGSFANSVSYVSLAFTGQWKEAAMKQSAPFELSEEGRRTLLKLARSTIEFFLEHRRIPTPKDLGVEITPELEQIAGAFVTLHKHGHLRGCIGEIMPRRPIYQAVIEQAVNAAVNDYRFPPVSKSEVPDLHIEISILTPPREVASYRDIIIGRHGMILTKHGRSAVFLPQVAPEQGWDLETTLTHLSLKAGLPPDAWKEGASYKVFEALVFSEDKA